MKDGSDAIADWPLLNALLNTACGASWVSLHHGGGVGIGYSIHAGMVVVADGTAMADRRLERVLTADPGTGVMRHADAGYDIAIETAKERGVDLPMTSCASSLTFPSSPPAAPTADRATSTRSPTPRWRGRARRSGGWARGNDLPAEYRGAEEIDAGGATVIPGLIDCHTHLAFAGWRADEFEQRIAGRSYLDIARAGGGIARTVRLTREATESDTRRPGRRVSRATCARSASRPSNARAATASTVRTSSSCSASTDPRGESAAASRSDLSRRAHRSSRASRQPRALSLAPRGRVDSRGRGRKDSRGSATCSWSRRHSR